MDFKEMFTSRLKAVRKEREYTQNSVVTALLDLSPDNEKLPKSDKVWQSYEKGRTEPSLESFAIICSLLGVSSDYLLGLSDEKKPQAKEFQQATGLSEGSISALVTMRDNDATAGLDIINRMFETGVFYRALYAINQAKKINDNLENELSEKVQAGAVAIQLENKMLKNMAHMLVPGEIARDYYITMATEEIKTLFELIVKGEKDDGTR